MIVSPQRTDVTGSPIVHAALAMHRAPRAPRVNANGDRIAVIVAMPLKLAVSSSVTPESAMNVDCDASLKPPPEKTVRPIVMARAPPVAAAPAKCPRDG